MSITTSTIEPIVVPYAAPNAAAISLIVPSTLLESIAKIFAAAVAPLSPPSIAPPSSDKPKLATAATPLTSLPPTLLTIFFEYLPAAFFKYFTPLVIHFSPLLPSFLPSFSAIILPKSSIFDKIFLKVPSSFPTVSAIVLIVFFALVPNLLLPTFSAIFEALLLAKLATLLF